MCKTARVPDALAYEDAVAQNITAWRAVRRLKQRNVAARMQELGFEWRQQTVARIEQGKRPVTTVELCGLALTFGVAIAELLRPPRGETELALPSGHTLLGDQLISLAYGKNFGFVTWDDDKPVFHYEKVRQFGVRHATPDEGVFVEDRPFNQD
jgi:transcriptional regulator with XRE-family HTH domain